MVNNVRIPYHRYWSFIEGYRAAREKYQKEKMFPIQSERGAKPHPTSIPWHIADLAYSIYSAKYGKEQSLERMAQRGGFSPSEMDNLLPDWCERCDKLTDIKAKLTATQARVKQLLLDRDHLQSCSNDFEAKLKIATDALEWVAKNSHGDIKLQSSEAVEKIRGEE